MYCIFLIQIQVDTNEVGADSGFISGSFDDTQQMKKQEKISLILHKAPVSVSNEACNQQSEETWLKFSNITQEAVKEVQIDRHQTRLCETDDLCFIDSDDESISGKTIIDIRKDLSETAKPNIMDGEDTMQGASSVKGNEWENKAMNDCDSLNTCKKLPNDYTSESLASPNETPATQLADISITQRAVSRGSIDILSEKLCLPRKPDSDEERDVVRPIKEESPVEAWSAQRKLESTRMKYRSDTEESGESLDHDLSMTGATGGSQKVSNPSLLLRGLAFIFFT